jgi:hypothetical protein
MSPSTSIFSDESLNHLHKLCRPLGMDPMSSIQRLELHVREERLACWDVVPVDVIRVFPFHEQRRAGPGHFSRLIGKVSDGGNTVGDDIERYAEFDRLIGGVHGVGK